MGQIIWQRFPETHGTWKEHPSPFAVGLSQESLVAVKNTLDSIRASLYDYLLEEETKTCSQKFAQAVTVPSEITLSKTFSLFKEILSIWIDAPPFQEMVQLMAEDRNLSCIEYIEHTFQGIIPNWSKLPLEPKTWIDGDNSFYLF